MRLLFTAIIFLFLTIEVRAQIFPPDFLCVRNDTLFWELPSNSCGTFSSYQIFISDDIAGPYTLLSEVTNATATNFFHSNPTGGTFYFYMQTSSDCPGEPTLQSDTLNNEPPRPSPISSVSVINGQVEINWISSPSPEVIEYIIYRTSPLGALPVDTVDATVNTYLDLNANPEGKAESYFIIAMDACGNTSIFDVPHFTIFVQSNYTSCERIIKLKWNKYRNWDNGIEDQELWISTNGGSPVLLDELTALDSTYAFSEGNDGDNYCFYIKATERITGIESFSNVECLTVDFVEPIRFLFLKNATVNDANQVELIWQWNDDAEVANVEFLEKSEDGNFATIDIYNPPANINSEVNQIVNGADPTSGKYFYQLKPNDDCDSTYFSNEVSTIYLTGTAQADQTNLINWTPFDRADGSIENYDIYRIVDGESSYVETVNGMTNSYIDPIDISNPGEANVCYYVIANAMIDHPDGFELPVASQSNTNCVVQLADLLVPNAFVPEGVNKEFKPRVVFIDEIVSYSLQIYDRWGQRIFESKSADQGWNGRDGFSYYPSGVYLYVIRMQQSNGRMVEKKGSVALIR